MPRLLVAPALAGLAGCAIALALHFTPPPGLPALAPVESGLAGAAAFFVLIAVINHFLAYRNGARLKALTAGLSAFEADLRRRVGRLETRMEALAGGETRAAPAKDVSKPEAAATDAAPSASMPAVGIWAAREGHEPPAVRRSRLSGARLSQALEEGAIEAWFQPVVTLPGRKTRYFEAVAYLREPSTSPETDTEAGAAKRIEEGYCRAPAIDRAMLLQSLKLLRELDRTNQAAGILWHLHKETLGDAHIYSGIERILEANASLARQLAALIDLRDYCSLDRSRTDLLHRLREIGFALALANCTDTAQCAAALRSGLFSIAVMDAAQLAGEPARSGFVHSAAAGRGIPADIEIIASGVTSEDQAMALIDQDILLAQGDYFSGARPARSQRAGAGAPD